MRARRRWLAAVGLSAGALVALTGGAAADSIGTGFAEFGEDVQGSEISLNLL